MYVLVFYLTFTSFINDLIVYEIINNEIQTPGWKNNLSQANDYFKCLNNDDNLFFETLDTRVDKFKIAVNPYTSGNEYLPSYVNCTSSPKFSSYLNYIYLDRLLRVFNKLASNNNGFINEFIFYRTVWGQILDKEGMFLNFENNEIRFELIIVDNETYLPGSNKTKSSDIFREFTLIHPSATFEFKNFNYKTLNQDMKMFISNLKDKKYIDSIFRDCCKFEL